MSSYYCQMYQKIIARLIPFPNPHADIFLILPAETLTKAGLPANPKFGTNKGWLVNPGINYLIHNIKRSCLILYGISVG